MDSAFKRQLSRSAVHIRRANVGGVIIAEDNLCMKCLDFRIARVRGRVR